ncbi:porin [Noviherbaspirillum saxi]|uniref:Porin n=1 Tax=Noviherbaspirillum saxi TaxID=2320863 RepID=A0A3A3FUY0_9BURK|nr:porin [Noviherbaspirillum saxi]RJF99603.1 porin [Noviherbaspirillum saxi]
MKKSLLALAVLGAFAGAAQAQSAVTIYGSFDGGVRYRTNVDAAGNNNVTMSSNGTFNSNRIGFRGVEDLGGGLNAHFTLETGFNTGTGALNNTANRLFERTASVGLGGSWGSVDLGRQYTNAFQTIASYDPFSYKYPGIADAVAATAGTRYDNDIKYVGKFGPVTARAEYALGEVAGNTSASSAKSIAGTFSSGAFTAGAAYTLREDATGTFDTDHWTVGGAAKFGPARVAVGYANQEADNATPVDAKTRWMWIGGNFALTPAFELTAAFYKTKLSGSTVGDKDNLMLGATYALSKRTNLYTLLDTQKYDGAARVAAAGNSRQRGIAVGVNHLF